jgi:hypothetical protein
MLFFFLALQEAVKRDPTSAVYRNNLASTLVKIMDFNGAKAAVEKASC